MTSLTVLNILLLLGTSNSVVIKIVEVEKDQCTRKDESESSLLNLNNFAYLISKPKITIWRKDNRWNPLFVVLIHSAPSHRELRNSIRETWLSDSPQIISYFLLGAVNSTEIQQEIEQEDLEYGDIIQGNFIDSYRNLTYKHAMAMKWFLDHSTPEIRFLVKLDDDVFVNIPSVHNFIMSNEHRRKFIAGFVHAEWDPVARHGKWEVTREEYADEYYPPYIAGHVIYSADSVCAIYEKAKTTKFFWIDDVFITGLCRIQINYELINITTMMIERAELNRMLADQRRPFVNPNFLFTVHEVTPEGMHILWNKTIHT